MNVQFEVLFDAIALVSCFGAILMACWGYRKWDIARRERKAEFLLKLLEKFREDDSIQQVVLAIDHGKDISKLEEGIKDRALSYMSYVCYLKKAAVVSDEEFAFFEYEITRTLGNPDIKKYLEFIYTFAEDNKCRSPFVALNEYEKGCAR